MAWYRCIINTRSSLNTTWAIDIEAGSYTIAVAEACRKWEKGKRKPLFTYEVKLQKIAEDEVLYNHFTAI